MSIDQNAFKNALNTLSIGPDIFLISYSLWTIKK